MKQVVLNYICGRLAERSTWSGLIAAAFALAGMTIPDQQIAALADAAVVVIGIVEAGRREKSGD